jgi:beta-lactamase regulating signal transducer with metallopeptidase domain
MITTLDTLGAAVWRASWQAAALALLVVLLLRCCGDRLAPRWRFLMWGVVLTRLLCVATPGSPWSVFNLLPRDPEPGARPIAHREVAATLTPTPLMPDTAAGPDEPRRERPHVTDSAPGSAVVPASAPTWLRSPSPAAAVESPASASWPFEALSLERSLSSIWLAGCLLMGLKLLATVFVLRRRLSACRPVTDAAVLDLLDTCRQRLGLRRTPVLLVTPECLSPCIVGTWRPRIVLPESLVTQSSPARLRHVLAHELAHLLRGDLWTNWLLLAARVLHWFNPVAWATARAMQAEREAACDEVAFAALGEAERPAYAATIVELAAGLSPSAIAPGLVGLFSSRFRLRLRVERLLRTPSIKTLRAPIATGLLLAVVLVGLTDAMPGARAPVRKAVSSAARTEPREMSHTVSGRCVNDADGSPMAGVTVRLYRVEGPTAPPVEAASTITDAEGRYSFPGLVPPRPEGHLDRLNYAVLGFADGRPIGISFRHFRGDREIVELRMAREGSTLSGKVVDAAGRPVAEATVLPYFAFDRPIPGLLQATTDAEGRFKLDNVGAFKWPDGKPVATSFAVLHPDYPETTASAIGLPADVVATLPASCIVTGTVTDSVTGQPAAGR